jgi:CRISPR-associated protein Cas1
MTTKSPNGGQTQTLVAAGYGLRVFVHRGHLVVEDGLGRDRRVHRLNRATAGLKRIVVTGHSGFVTLEALRWIRDVGASFVQIDSDGNLITVTAADRRHETKLRREQATAGDTGRGREIVVRLLRTKLERQADNAASRLAEHKSVIVRNHRDRISIAEAIREQSAALNADLSIAQLRKIESIAGRYYWQAWARVPIHFDAAYTARVPEHWYRAGPRTSSMDRQWPRRAMTPAHALLNYAYAILETEAIMAAYAVGLDPSLGLMHADVRYRSSLATDLMEPVRPIADQAVLDLLTTHKLNRGDAVETRRGVCRLGLPLIDELVARSNDLRRAVAPEAETVARQLLGRAKAPTPLTRANHRIATAGRTTRGAVQ